MLSLKNELLQTDTGLCTNLSTGECVDLHSVRKKTIKNPVYSEAGQKIIQANHIACNYFKWQLKKSGDAKTYLKSRGFEESDEFGYAGSYGNELYRYLRAEGVDEEIILSSGLVRASENKGIVDLFWDRIIVPIRNIDGYIVAFGGRTIKESKCKYINTPETEVFKKGENLFMYNEARNADCDSFILCEGYMDVLTMHKHGFTNAVASLGTSLTEYQTILLQAKPHVYIMYDMDEAGIKASLRAIPMLKNEMVKVTSLRPFKDPDEFLREKEKGQMVLRIYESRESKDFIKDNFQYGQRKNELLKYLL